MNGQCTGSARVSGPLAAGLQEYKVLFKRTRGQSVGLCKDMMKGFVQVIITVKETIAVLSNSS